MARDLRLQVLLSTVDKVTGPLKKVMNGGRETDKALKALNDRMGLLRRSQDELNEFSSLKTGLKTLKPALDAAQAKANELAREIQNTERPTKKLVASFEAAKAEAKRLKTEFTKGSQQVVILRDRLGAAGVATDHLENAQMALRLKIKATNKAMQDQKRHLEQVAAKQRQVAQQAERMQKIGMTAAAAGAGAVVLGQQAMPAATAPMSAFMEQDAAAAMLRSSLMGSDGKVSADYEQVAALASRLGNQLPGTTAELTLMMDELAKAGINSKAILGGVGEAAALLKVRIGDSMSYSEAAKSMAVLQTATKTTEADMVALADTMQRAAGMNVAPDKMVAAFSNLAPALSMMRTEGLDAVNKLAPLITAAVRGGMGGESAGIAIVSAMRRSMDADRVAKANEALGGTGINLDFTDGKGEFGGLDKAFEQLEQLRSLTTAHRNEVLKQLYGDDAQASTIADIISKGGADGYAEIQRGLAAQGSLQQRVNMQLDSLPAKWESATGTLQNTLAKLGEAMAPMVIPLIEAFTGLLERIQGFIAANPKLAGTLGVVAAGFAGLAVAAGVVLAPIGLALTLFGHVWPYLANLGPMLAGLKASFAAIGAAALPALKAVGAALAGISVPIWGVIAVVATAAALIYKYWDYIAAFFGGVWDGIVTAIQPVRAAFADAFAPLAPIIDRLGSALGGAWRWITSLLAPAEATRESMAGWASAGKTLGAVLGSVFGFIAKAVLLPITVMQVAAKVMKTLFEWSPLGLVVSNWGAITAFFSGMWEGILTAMAPVRAAFSAAFAPLGPLIGGLGNALGIAWNGIVTAMAPVRAAFSAAFAPLGPLIDGLGNALGIAWNGIVTAMAPVRAAFSAAFAPLNAAGESLAGWADAGRRVGEVLGAVFVFIARAVLFPITMIEWAWKAMKVIFAWSPLGLIASNWGAITGALGVVWDGVKAGAAMLWEWLKTAFAWSPLGLIASNWGAITGALGVVWDGVKAGVATLWGWLNSAFAGGYSRLVADIAAIISVVSGLWERFKSIGSNLLQGLVQGLLGGLAAVKDTIGNVANSVVGWLKEKLGIHSPSRVFAELGGFTVSGFAQGLDAARREPVEAMRRVAGAVTAAGAAMAVGASGSALAIDSRPPLGRAAPAAAGSAGITIGKIEIHAGAGADAQAIAQAVRAELERLQRESGARRRSALSDNDL